MRPRMTRIIAASVLALLFIGGAAWADENHYINNLIGDRASGMGGAYTAVSDDVSGLYYNPAGVVYSTGRNLSGSVNAYANWYKKYDMVIGANSWERRSTTLLPNFFGVVQPVGNLRVGLSYAVPDAIIEDQDQTFYNVPSSIPGVLATTYRINFNNDDRTYNFGPSVAMEISKNMAIGLTLYLHYRDTQSILNQLIFLANGNTELTNQYYELHERGYRPVLGFIWSPKDQLSVGLSVSKTFLTNEDVTTQSIFKGTTFPADRIDLTDTSTNTKKKYPLQARAGVAYFPSSRLLISADLIYNEKVTDATFGNRVALVNGAVGAEYYLDKNWAMRAGYFTDLSNTPNLSVLLQNQQEQVNLNGISLSISNFTRNTSITLGGTYSMGKGKAQVIADSTAEQDVSVKAWTLFLSSSYSY